MDDPEGSDLYQYSFGMPQARTDADGLRSASGPDAPLDTSACNETCSAAFPPASDPAGYARCMAGCVNGQRGFDCGSFCARWSDPREKAACLAGCNAGQGRVGGNCVVTCPVTGSGPPTVLLGACAVAVAAPEPVVTKTTGLVLGAVGCGCIAWELLDTSTRVNIIPIPRVAPIPISTRPRPRRDECYCMCLGTDDLGRGHGPNPIGRMTRSACKALPYANPRFTFCLCKGDP